MRRDNSHDAEHAECGPQPEVDQQAFAGTGQRLPQRGIRLADRDHRQHGTVRRRGWAPGRRACARPRRRGRPTTPGPRHPAATEVGVVADAGRVRRRPHRAVGTENLGQPGTRECDRAIQIGRQHPRGERVGVAVTHDRCGREVLGYRDHALAAHLAELAVDWATETAATAASTTATTSSWKARNWPARLRRADSFLNDHNFLCDLTSDLGHLLGPVLLSITVSEWSETVSKLLRGATALAVVAAGSCGRSRVRGDPRRRPVGPAPLAHDGAEQPRRWL